MSRVNQYVDLLLNVAELLDDWAITGTSAEDMSEVANDIRVQLDEISEEFDDDCDL